MGRLVHLLFFDQREETTGSIDRLETLVNNIFHLLLRGQVFTLMGSMTA